MDTMDELTPGQKKTAAARDGRRKAALQRKVGKHIDFLRIHGYTVLKPETGWSSGTCGTGDTEHP